MMPSSQCSSITARNGAGGEGVKSSLSQYNVCACSAGLQDADEAEGCPGADVPHPERH